MKMTMLPPYLDQLDNERQAVFKALSRFSPPFTLGGGTAIMLQIGHRQSYDFDCFSEEIIDSTLISTTKRVFGHSTTIKTKTQEIITMITPNNIEITFIAYPYRPLKKSVQTNGIALFHMDDLTANKAFTIGRRPAWRDYVDLFMLMKLKIYSLDQIIKLAESKYSGEFSEKLFLQQLTYFDDVPIMETKFLKSSHSDEEIKTYLQNKVRKHLTAILP